MNPDDDYFDMSYQQSVQPVRSPSIREALALAKWVMWSGPYQGAIFIVSDGESTFICQYDHLGVEQLLGLEVQFVVVPGEFAGDCVVL